MKTIIFLAFTLSLSVGLANEGLTCPEAASASNSLTRPLPAEVIAKMTNLGFDLATAQLIFDNSPEYATKVWRAAQDWAGGPTVIENLAAFRKLPRDLQAKLFAQKFFRKMDALSEDEANSLMERRWKFPIFDLSSPRVISVYRGMKLDSPDIFDIYNRDIKYVSSSIDPIENYWAQIPPSQLAEYSGSSRVSILLEFRVPAYEIKYAAKHDDIVIHPGPDHQLKDISLFIYRIGIVDKDGSVRWGAPGQRSLPVKQ